MAGFIDGCDGVSAVGFLHLQSVLSRRAELAVQNKNAILIRILDGNIGSDGCRLLILRGRFFRCLVDQFYVIDIITIAALQGSCLAAFLSAAGQGYDV